MKPHLATCIPRNKEVLVWGTANLVLSPDFCRAEAGTRCLNINGQVSEIRNQEASLRTSERGEVEGRELRDQLR